ncbi:sigma factor-like helix-turn-helix DNA-binding protein [Gordonia caeni]|uniref:RNA polymerase sigma-70 region 4 domain-containing protein n=1 Tax=Gordonia caeni TaxID=1007097 RepID=A0ABP7PUH8_9ACTN
MSTDPPHSTEHPAAPGARLVETWCDVAPWLEDLRTDPEFFWIDDDPADADPEVVHAHCDLIAVLMVETQSTVPLGELLPLLPGGVDLIPDPELPTRAANWLLQSSTFTTDRIGDVTTAGILGHRGMGMGSVLPLLSRLAALSVEADAYTGDGSGGRQRAVADLVRDLETIARWRAAAGDDDTPLMDPVPEFAPQAVREAHHRLSSITAQSPAVAAATQMGVAEQLSARMDALAERDLEVFFERRLTDTRTRLEAIGERFGVSRERVRQYEARALDELYEWVQGSGEAQFVVASAVRVISTVRPLADVLSALPVFGDEVEAVRRPLWRVLVGIGVPFEVDGDWAAAPTLDSAREATEKHLRDRADEFGVLSPERVAEINTARLPGESPDWGARWAASLGYVTYRGQILIATTTIEDYAAAVLSIHGTPMTPEELVGSFHVERSARSMVNQMTGDDRFQRVSRTHWGLRAWGGREYATIRAAIGDLLDESGGSAPLDRLVDELSSAFDVKPASVIAYAAAPPYRTDDGVVTRTGNAPQSRKSPAQTRHLYRIGDAWKLRFTVNAEHLRGSGSPLPVALATALDLDYGDVRHLDSPAGEQLVSWSALQPSLGSTRRFFTDHALDEPAEAFFVFTDGGGFDVEPVRSGSTGPAQALLAAVGAPESPDDGVLTVLAAAVGLPDDSSADRVREALLARGEDDLAALVGEL